jgi:hypothetical protein
VEGEKPLSAQHGSSEVRLEGGVIEPSLDQSAASGVELDSRDYPSSVDTYLLGQAPGGLTLHLDVVTGGASDAVRSSPTVGGPRLYGRRWRSDQAHMITVSGV